MNIEFWFDFASTYSYPAALRIESLAASRGVSVSWRAFLLGPIFQQQGWNDSPFNIYPVKGRYMWRDLERICNRYDFPLQRPTVFPRNGLHAARVACTFSNESWLPDFVRSVYRANFERNLEIAEPAVVIQCLTELGLDGQAILAASQMPVAKDQLRARTAEAVERGIFGAPTFVVGDELFWGHDRLDEALQWASASSARSK